MAKSPEELAHLEWLGYVQPLGLVVSVPAMLEAQCYVNKNIMGEHARFLSCLPCDTRGEPIPEIRDISEFTSKVLGWEAEDLKEVPQRVALIEEMAPLEVVLPQYHESLRPTHAVPVFQPKEDESPWMMLVHQLATGTELDEPGEADSSRHWNAAPQAKFERLLRETQVPIGLLSNGRQLRLVYSPRGETSGHATFNVDEMMQVAGRPMFAALHMLLCSERMFSLGDNQRLPAVLAKSRKYQNTVSTKLAEQVLAALYELMRGFQAANDVSGDKLLGPVLANKPNHVYSGLLTVLMRLVFVMYAEDRDLLSSYPVYSNHYSVTGLFDRLRSDAGRFPDTMDQRFGSWSQLITLFRLVYEGGQHGDFKIPPRKGYLFDPDRYLFLEGRSEEELASHRDLEKAPAELLNLGGSVPRIPDGVVFRVLQNLLILDGERLSYRTLDVEQIGSVYETVMGFNLEVAKGKSIAVKPAKTHGAPATINLETLLETKGKDRAKWLKEQADQTLGTAVAKQLKEAESIDDLLVALDKKIAKKVTPRVVPAGAIVLQPSDERRRSGSHYTPRSLTEPIVRTTLEPILKQLCDPESPLPSPYSPSKEDNRRYTAGELAVRIRASEKKITAAEKAREVGTPHPSQILALKICDPAMGSGAFLVEACRQLGDELIKAWYAHDLIPTTIPPDEDELLYARRQVAQRCLYGVDKNIMAVDLAKLSLWLVTLARDHAFTFLDHSLRHGDSLVGLKRSQIIGFHWEPKKQKQFGEDKIQQLLDQATAAREKILNAREDVPYRDQESCLAKAEESLKIVRATGDACVSAFFAGSRMKDRDDCCKSLYSYVSDWYSSGHDAETRGPIAAAVSGLRQGEHPLSPFHWEIEFSEVFSRRNGGFDAFVGNPPFAGKNTLAAGSRDGYSDWLKAIHPESHGNADLVAHFFRCTFDRLRYSGCFGLIATNTIGQGDTRATGIRWICRHEGQIYNARRRVKWPGVAAVVVSVIHVCKGTITGNITLDGKCVPAITAFLFHRGGHENPHALSTNLKRCFQGIVVLGPGFTFDDTDSSGEANSVETMNLLMLQEPANADRIVPYIGGDEFNSTPSQKHHRHIINFGDLDESRAQQWPMLFEIVETRVKPKRLRDKRLAYRKYWWQFAEKRPDMTKRLARCERVLARALTSKHYEAFAFLDNRLRYVYDQTLIVFLLEQDGGFALLASRVHQVWSAFFGATLEDRPRYNIRDCFENFPFPRNSDAVERAGHEYLLERRMGMDGRNEGLTKTYNRFHDRQEKSPEILKLRELHELMDRAVLNAYGWDDLAKSARCDFLLDYEEDDDQMEGGTSPRGRKPWRLRWPDDFRDEVLARLLELNEQRHKEELLAGSSPLSEKCEVKEKSKKPKKAVATPLFNDQDVLTEQERMTLAIMSAWGEGMLVDRLAFGEAVALWINDKHRNFRARESTQRQKRLTPSPDMQQLIGRAVRRGWIAPALRGEIDFLKLIVNPSPLGELTNAESKKLEQIRFIVHEERFSESPKIEITEDSIRATAPFAFAE